MSTKIEQQMTALAAIVEKLVVRVEELGGAAAKQVSPGEVVGIGVRGVDGSVSTDSGGRSRGSVSWSDEVEEASGGDGCVVKSGAEEESDQFEEAVCVQPVKLVGGGVVTSGDVGKRVVRRGSGVGSEVSDSVTSSDESVVMPDGVVLRSSVKSVRFGGVEDVGESSVDGGFRAFVRNDRVKSLVDWLKAKAGVVIPSKARRQLALSLYTAGAVPTFFVDGKTELKALAVVGDAAMTLALAKHSFRCGLNVEATQAMRSKELSDVVLRQKLIESGLCEMVVAPIGVDLAVSKAGATAVEAIAGVLDLAVKDQYAVTRFMHALGLLRGR